MVVFAREIGVEKVDLVVIGEAGAVGAENRRGVAQLAAFAAQQHRAADNEHRVPGGGVGEKRQDDGGDGLGGDAPLMAGILTTQTAFAALTIPSIIAWLT